MIFIEIAHAGVISSAPSLQELMLHALSWILSVASVIALIAILLAGVMYMSASGDTRRINFAKKAFIGSVVGLIIVVTALIVVHTLDTLAG